MADALGETAPEKLSYFIIAAISLSTLRYFLDTQYAQWQRRAWRPAAVKWVFFSFLSEVISYNPKKSALLQRETPGFQAGGFYFVKSM
jgi:hypothetical protein